MENIIKRAIEGGYEGLTQNDLDTKNYTDDVGYALVCDPLFWQALEESRKPYEDSFGMGDWKKLALKFHDINLTQGWNDAVKYLSELINQ